MRATTPGHPSVQQTIEVTAGQTVHFRIVASNSFGTTFGEDKSFKAPNKPSITASASANVTASTADLIAKINPNGDATTYHFEYGTSPSYDHVIPIPDESIGNGETPVEVSQHIENLDIGATYHFRVVAENQWGEVASSDQTFAFFTANCPNAHVRQQSGAAYLPDCRAYELVSPEVAGAVQLFPGQGLGPIVNEFIAHPLPSNTGLATLAVALRLLGRNRSDQRHRSAEHHPGSLRLDPDVQWLENPLPRPLGRDLVRLGRDPLQRVHVSV